MTRRPLAAVNRSRAHAFHSAHGVREARGACLFPAQPDNEERSGTTRKELSMSRNNLLLVALGTAVTAVALPAAACDPVPGMIIGGGIGAAVGAAPGAAVGAILGGAISGSTPCYYAPPANAYYG